MRRILKLIFQLLGVVVLCFILTVVWVLFDGLTDLGDKADVALVLGTPESPEAMGDQPLLDRTVKLFNESAFPCVIVSGSKTKGESEAMAKYLEGKGIPAGVVFIDDAVTTPDAVRKATKIMAEHELNSVMIITDYYHVTRTKLAFIHDGVTSIQKAHIGVLNKSDAPAVGREVIEIYNYIMRVYIMPAVEKIKEEAKTGADKAKADAETARKKVDKGLDSMSK